MFGFIISTLSYYKSYKINNSLTAAIEDYGGFNDYSKEEIEKRLTSYGYTRSNSGCSVGNDDFNNNRVRLVKADGSIINDYTNLKYESEFIRASKYYKGHSNWVSKYSLKNYKLDNTDIE